MKITNITKKYKDNIVLDHLNFSFDSSHIVGLIGKNGVGKTTIMKIMNGNIVNFKGKVDFDQNQKIGYLIEHPKLYQDLLIMQNIGDGQPIKNEVVEKTLGIYILLFLFYGLFLFLITLLVKSSSLVFSIGVFLILIIPIATNLVPLIPEYGDEVKKALEYIPFNFLIDNVWLGSLKLNGWQTFISIASIILLAIIDFFTISKRDY